MRAATAWIAGILVLPMACGSSSGDGSGQPDANAPPDAESEPDAGASDAGDETYPNPIVTFTQEGKPAGIDRSREPPSAGPFSASGTYSYGGWLADLDGDERLDYYAVNHSQTPHLSGLFINNGAGFGQNLFTVSLQPSPVSPPNMGNSNEMKFVGDLTGDGRVDFFFTGWIGLGVMCANQGVVQGSDWTGPGYLCYGTSDALAFADVNGDGKIDVMGLDLTNFEAYTAYYSHTARYVWRLNNGDPNITTWPTTDNFLDLRVTDPGSPFPGFVDLNGDGIPDKIVGIPLPPGSRGPNGTTTGGEQVYLGQASGGYVLQSGTGLEAVTDPITNIEDVNDDGCLDIGTDATGYRDNQRWYIQNKTGTSCNMTFTFTPRTALPYYPGFKRYAVDIDNSGRLSKLVIVHTAYSTNDGHPGGVSIYRKLFHGDYTIIPPDQSGININAAGASEFYADNLTPGDWNDDGRLDLAGTGNWTMPDTDSGFALWTLTLAATNGWIKVTLATVTGFFTGRATIEVFDACCVGDPSHHVTPPRTLYAGRAWPTQVYHFGIGTRTSVAVRVTFPDGHEVIHADVVPGERITILP